MDVIQDADLDLKIAGSIRVCLPLGVWQLGRSADQDLRPWHWLSWRVGQWAGRFLVGHRNEPQLTLPHVQRASAGGYSRAHSSDPGDNPYAESPVSALATRTKREQACERGASQRPPPAERAVGSCWSGASSSIARLRSTVATPGLGAARPGGRAQCSAEAAV